MKLLHRKSKWEQVKEPVVAKAKATAADKRTLHGGLIAVGAAVGVTAVSSAISSLRKKKA